MGGARFLGQEGRFACGKADPPNALVVQAAFAVERARVGLEMATWSSAPGAAAHRLPPLMLKIDELTDGKGELISVYLRVAANGAGSLEIVDADGALPLPAGALEKVLARYGAPFDPEASITVVGELLLGDGQRLRHVRHLAGYDVVPRDYLVLELGGGEALCALGASVTGALQYLARAALRSAPR